MDDIKKLAAKAKNKAYDAAFFTQKLISENPKNECLVVALKDLEQAEQILEEFNNNLPEE